MKKSGIVASVVLLVSMSACTTRYAEPEPHVQVQPLPPATGSPGPDLPAEQPLSPLDPGLEQNHALDNNDPVVVDSALPAMVDASTVPAGDSALMYQEQPQQHTPPPMSAYELDAGLRESVRNGNAARVSQLIAQGANVNASNEAGESLLHVAATMGHENIVVQLIGQGARVDVETQNGWTPLHSAARFGHYPVVQLLLRAGAARDRVNADGKTPLMLAQQLGHYQIVELLRD